MPRSPLCLGVLFLVFLVFADGENLFYVSPRHPNLRDTMMLPHRDKWDVHYANMNVDEMVYIGRDVFVIVCVSSDDCLGHH